MNIFQSIFDFIFFPVRVVLPNEWSSALGLTSMRDERIRAVGQYLKGRLLDLGCGINELIKEYKNGYGVDVYPWSGIDVLCDTRRLPFKNASFDCCTLLASLNHVPSLKRADVLQEAKRVLKNKGLIIVTMINPVLGNIGHLTIWRWWDPDQKISGIKEGEEFGMWSDDVKSLLEEVGFKIVIHKKFTYNLNNLFVFEKV